MNNWLLISIIISVIVVIVSYLNNGDDNKNGFAS